MFYLLFTIVNLVNGFIDDSQLHYNEYNYDYDNIDNDIISFKTNNNYYYYNLVILCIFFIYYFL